MLPYAPSLVVADLSFISLAAVVPTLVGLAADEATFVVLVKPQFEAGPGAVGRGGVVRDPSTWAAAIQRVADAFTSAGAGVRGLVTSPLRGPAGNVEFLLHAVAGEATTFTPADVEAALEEGRRLTG
jgi:23S rRNA (cytidine1920-2'-O)/16S rRNA (cytidine1409-2'-O)-methyltransferase